MFFVGIFGIENKQKEIKSLENIDCKTCGTKIMGTLIKSYEYFHIFFIPIFRWNEKYYVMCKRCNSIYELSKEKGKEIEYRKTYQITLSDLTLIQEGERYGKIAMKKVCSNCGRNIEGEYNYCPYCGSKM